MGRSILQVPSQAAPLKSWTTSTRLAVNLWGLMLEKFPIGRMRYVTGKTIKCKSQD
jgi:hypothetical protein